VGSWNHFETLSLNYGACYGLAVSSVLRIIAISSSSSQNLSMFGINVDGTITAAAVFGGGGSGPLQFNMGNSSGTISGMLAFTEGSTTPIGVPTLLVTEGSNNRVQEINVLTRSHIGYLPGSIYDPHGVAANKSRIAVSALSGPGSGVHVVHLFDATTRALLLTTAPGLLGSSIGLRFTDDGLNVAVADYGNARLTMFSVADGSSVKNLPTGCSPYDIEECTTGWVVADKDSNKVHLVPSDGTAVTTASRNYVAALARIPGTPMTMAMLSTDNNQLHFNTMQ
jgi:hypothetical protein